MSKCYWENDADGLVQHRVVPNLQSEKKKKKPQWLWSAVKWDLPWVAHCVRSVHLSTWWGWGWCWSGDRKCIPWINPSGSWSVMKQMCTPPSTAWKPSVGVLPRDPYFTDEEAKMGSGLLRGSLSQDSGPSSLPSASNLSVHSLTCPPATHPLSIHPALRVQGWHALHQLWHYKPRQPEWPPRHLGGHAHVNPAWVPIVAGEDPAFFPTWHSGPAPPLPPAESCPLPVPRWSTRLLH